MASGEQQRGEVASVRQQEARHDVAAELAVRYVDEPDVRADDAAHEIARRRAHSDAELADLSAWVFPPDSSASSHVVESHTHYARIAEAGDTKFWFHVLRNAFITVAEREFMLSY